MAWTVVTGCIEVPHCSIVLKVVHPVLNPDLGRCFFILELMRKNILLFLDRTCLIVMFDAAYPLLERQLTSTCAHFFKRYQRN